MEKKQRLTILLHGEPGTGKTMFARQMAKQLNGQLYQLDFPKIQCKWVGQTQKNIQKAFADYADLRRNSKVPVILLINEADGLMNRRVAIHTSNDVWANQAQTEFLERLENFEGILIATSNLFANFDEAFHRRFLFKQKIQKPSEDVRKEVLKTWKYRHLIIDFDEILQLNWTMAQLKNIEEKLEILSTIRETSTNDLTNLFTNELITTSSSQKIGFSFGSKGSA